MDPWPRLRSSRMRASTRRSRRCSRRAHRAVSRARITVASDGRIFIVSTSAEWLSAKRPAAASAPACARSSSTRSSDELVLGSSRRAAPNQRAALRRALLRGLAGLTKRRHRVEISVPRGPLRRGVPASREARHARQVPGRSARARRFSIPRESTRTRHAARADGGSGTSGARPSAESGRAQATPSSIASSSTSVTSAAAAANSDSERVTCNRGSVEAHASPRRREVQALRRAPRRTADGTSTPPSVRSRPPARPPC